jgi:hypothetical protein
MGPWRQGDSGHGTMGPWDPAGFSVYFDKGYLYAEYMATLLCFGKRTPTWELLSPISPIF